MKLISLKSALIMFKRKWKWEKESKVNKKFKLEYHEKKIRKYFKWTQLSVLCQKLILNICTICVDGGGCDAVVLY